jgi:hypothetical protein
MPLRICTWHERNVRDISSWYLSAWLVISFQREDCTVYKSKYYSNAKHDLNYFVGFSVFAAVVMKRSVFWDVKPSIPLKLNRCFGGIYHLSHQGRRISDARNEHEAGGLQIRRNGRKLEANPSVPIWLLLGSDGLACSSAYRSLHAFLHDLLSDHENRGDTFLWNVGSVSTDYKALYFRRLKSSQLTSLFLIYSLSILAAR